MSFAVKIGAGDAGLKFGVVVGFGTGIGVLVGLIM
jgi:hypothetical protein